MTKLLTTLALIVGLLFGGVAPAAAEPAPDPDTCTVEMLEVLRADVLRWQDLAERAFEDAAVAEAQSINRALFWQDRALDYSVQLGARTQERDRLLVMTNRLTAQRNRMQAKVAELRAKIRVLR